MVQKCYTCGSAKTDNVKLHGFPKDINLREKWVAQIKKYVPIIITKYTRLCSKHFINDDYYQSSFGNDILKPDAVPSRFFCSRKSLLPEFEVRASMPTGKPILTINDNLENLMIEEEIVVNEDENNSTISMNNDTYYYDTEVTTQQENENNDITTKVHLSEKKRKLLRYAGDFSEEDLETPRKRKMFWKTYQQMIKSKNDKIKLLQQKNRSLKSQINNLNSLIDDLQSQSKLNANGSYMLKNIASDEEKHLLMRQLKLGSGKNITPELRKFALTLHYYSPSAYLYIRKIFSKALPDISTIRKWYTTINGLPGLTRESFQAISIKVNEMKNIGKQLYGCLIIDEMSIKQHVQWTGSRHQGYVDYGQGGGTDSMDNFPYAKDAFVIMVVGLNTHWKVPIAYYLVNGISAEEKSNIIKSCLHQLHETGIIIKTITFDGAANNMAMVSLLGANLNYADLKPNFKHPLTEDNVHIVLDPCHMVKLIRNCLGDWGLLFDKNNKQIKWVYFKHLVDMQNVTGLHAATKIRTRHIHYHREKMKVRLATQVFSNSVADALEYCCKDLKNNHFEDAEATIEFCRRINNIFDLLNSRHFLSKSLFNKPLSDNFLNLNIFIDESIDYLNGIQCLEKLPKYGKRSVLQSERKTGFLGLITCLKTIKNLYSELTETKLLQFLLTYKFNQDHIELLFGAIRAKGGFNNNPTVAQFEAAYKSIIINAEVKCPSTANALALDNTSILRISSAPPKKDEQSEMLDLLCAAGTEIIETEDILDIYEHRNYLNDVVTYIAGFVVYKIKKNILCTVCEKSLGTKESGSALIGRKNRGGLIVSNPDVIEICKIAERVIRGYQRIDGSNVVKRTTIECMRKININKYFISLSNHFLEQESFNNHLLQLLKLIMHIYITLKLHHINSSTNSID